MEEFIDMLMTYSKWSSEQILLFIAAWWGDEEWETEYGGFDTYTTDTVLVTLRGHDHTITITETDGKSSISIDGEEYDTKAPISTDSPEADYEWASLARDLLAINPNEEGVKFLNAEKLKEEEKAMKEAEAEEARAKATEEALSRKAILTGWFFLDGTVCIDRVQREFWSEFHVDFDVSKLGTKAEFTRKTAVDYQGRCSGDLNAIASLAYSSRQRMTHRVQLSDYLAVFKSISWAPELTVTLPLIKKSEWRNDVGTYGYVRVGETTPRFE